MSAKRGHQWAAVFTVLALLLTGCSSGAVTESATTAATTTTATPTVVTTVTTTTEVPVSTTGLCSHSTVATTTKTPTTKPTTKPTTANKQNELSAVDMMAGIKAKAVTDKDATEERFVNAHTQFSVKLLQGALKAEQGGNVLVSPLSVQLTLAMVANGANGKTKTEMETVFGGIPMSELNRYLYNYWTALPMADEYKVQIANSLWINSRSGINVPKTFLQTNADYYGAQVYKGDFSNKTINDMNYWVKQNTGGTVDRIVDRLDSKNDMMVLLNTLFFEASWEKTYGSSHVSTGKFTAANGAERTVTMMTQTETMRYINDGEATGFAKDYKDGYYSFVALMPNKGTSLDEYVASLTAEKVQNALGSGALQVHAALPKFAYECDLDMNAILTEMGMPTAFSESADFSGLDTANNDARLSEVRHKTHIELSEEGTKAGAATAAKVLKGIRDVSVTLDRPFVYMIVDNTTYLPIFVGAVRDIGT